MRAHTQVCAHNIFILEKCGTLVSKQAKVAEVAMRSLWDYQHRRSAKPSRVGCVRECGGVLGCEYIFSHFLGGFRVSLVGRRYLYRPTSIAR